VKYFNSVSEASMALAISMVKKPLSFGRTDNYWQLFGGLESIPFLVLFKDKKGNKVETLSTFALWEHDVETYLESLPGAYLVEPEAFKYCYFIDYMSMNDAVYKAAPVKFLGKGDKSLMPKLKVDGAYGNYYIESSSQVEAIFCDTEIVSWEVIPNINFDPSLYE
jgi:hypothetical protein